MDKIHDIKRLGRNGAGDVLQAQAAWPTTDPLASNRPFKLSLTALHTSSHKSDFWESSFDVSTGSNMTSLK